MTFRHVAVLRAFYCDEQTGLSHQFRAPILPKVFLAVSYWVAVFEFLAPEVTDFVPENVFGLTWSEDGMNWPAENGQIVNDGLAPDERGWWRGRCAPLIR